jgi:sulfite exporter TauE/SafE
MELLIAMLPIYIMGNVHCLGMCGPIAMWIGSSRFRLFYLLGRLIAFTFAGTIAGGLGEVIGAFLSAYHLSGFFSLILGVCMIGIGILTALGHAIPFPRHFNIQGALQRWLLIDEPWPLFLLGAMTIALPCGQTLLVYSACALSGSMAEGTCNGFVFGLLTTPALLLAMHARRWISKAKPWYEPIVAIAACGVGVLACLRGLAEWGVIPHAGIHHFVVY